MVLAVAGAVASTLPALLAAPIVGAGTRPDGPADPAVVREQVRDVMSRPEFSYEPSWVERALHWVGEQLQRLFGGAEVSGGSFGGGIGALLAWVMIVAAISAVVVLLVWILTTRARSGRRRTAPSVDIEVEHRRRAVEWLADAERLEADGEWKEAMRARFRHLVRVLLDRRQLPDVPGRTTGELRADLDHSTPSAHEEFDTCSVLFELPWYGDVATGPQENARFRVAADAVLTAAMLRPFGIASLPEAADAAPAPHDVDAVGTR